MSLSVFVCIITTLISCSSDEECIYESVFIFQNRSDATIDADLFVLAPDETLKFSVDQTYFCDEKRKTKVPFPNELTLFIDDTLCLPLTSDASGSAAGILSLDNYQNLLDFEYGGPYLYVFTQDIVDQAIPCN